MLLSMKIYQVQENVVFIGKVNKTTDVLRQRTVNNVLQTPILDYIKWQPHAKFLS